ncbi:MAG: GtrA family protein [Muribaculaceae bacterium]|nr:GtrA family protein [Muribaculaceae bacterium]
MQLKRIGETLLKSDSLIITYLRSTVSSQCASWTDYIVCFCLFALTGIGAFWATAIGAVCGGIINCIINYKFTFRAEGCPWRAVVVKYAFVWVGSLLLNSYGTEAFYGFVQSNEWLQSLNLAENTYFIGSRLFISLLVSLFWNFTLQRYVVYRHMPFDRYIVRVLGGTSKTEQS